MSRFHVGTIDEGGFAVPPRYAAHSEGYRRLELVDHTISPAAVHMGVGLAEIAPGGFHQPVIHAFEKGFFVLGGEVILQFHGRAHHLSAGHFGVIAKAVPYTLFNPGDAPVRLLDMNAPQPKPGDHDFADTIFQPGEVARAAAVPDLDDPRIKYLGRFDETRMAGKGDNISAVGVRSSSIRGIVLAEMIDRMFGAYHLALFMVQFQPGGVGTTHDHPLEETYFVMSGRARATLDGEAFDIGPGQFVWTGVGCFHQFECLGDEPVRWIETQAPLPADYETFRFRREWDPLALD
jgi:mannose-6-phosphate isomerase-like protein (cupin superfamily)